MLPTFLKALNLKDTEYFLTGSHAFDKPDFQVSKPGSDYDYVVEIKCRYMILQYLASQNIQAEFSCYNGGFKFIENGNTYNIITCIDIEFKAWRDALAVMKYFIDTDQCYRNAINQKIYRYAIYEQLRGICKSILTMGRKES